MNDVVSEFFYDGIRRIVPGLVMIFLYWHLEVASVLEKHNEFHKDFPLVIFTTCILLIAWLVGFALEQMLEVVCAFVWWKFGKRVLEGIRKKEWVRDKLKNGNLKLTQATLEMKPRHKRS